jgi:hypothetical protein
LSRVGKTAEECEMDYLKWIHEISQSALAAAVLTLGVVILLELHSISRLRRSVDANLQRVFEQLDLLRFESQQHEEMPVPSARAKSTETIAGVRRLPAVMPTLPAAQVAGSLTRTPDASSVSDGSGGRGLGAGEARLLASLTAARAKLGRAVGQGA